MRFESFIELSGIFYKAMRPSAFVAHLLVPKTLAAAAITCCCQLIKGLTLDSIALHLAMLKGYSYQSGSNRLAIYILVRPVLSHDTFSLACVCSSPIHPWK